MAGKTYPLLAASLAAVFALSTCSRDVKPTPEFERTDYERVVVSSGVEPGALDPQMSGDMATGAIICQLMDGLVGTDVEGKIIPVLAERWESKGERVWAFHLRDVKWSNGDPITVKDFVYSFRRLADPATGTPFGSYLVDAQVGNAEDILNGKTKPETLGVKALDTKTLQFTLIAPAPYFPDMLIQQFMFPVYRATVERYGNKWTRSGHYVSSGVYLLKDREVNSHINMERNPNYYDKDKMAIPKAVFLSGSGEYNRYHANEIGVTYGIPSDQVKMADTEFPGQVKRTTSLCSWYLEPNHETAPFNDPRVREALNMLTRHGIVVKVGGRGDTPAFQLMSPQMQGVIPVYPEWKEWTPERRIETACKLSNEAGYNDDHPPEFDILYNTSEVFKKQITAVQSVWEATIPFIRPTLSSKEWKTYLDTRAQGNFKVSFSGWCFDFNDPVGILNILKSNNSNSALRYKNVAFDAFTNNMLKDGVSKEARSRLYADAEKRLQEDTALIPLHHQVEVRMVKPDVIGYSDKDPLWNYTVRSWSFAPKK